MLDYDLVIHHHFALMRAYSDLIKRTEGLPIWYKLPVYTPYEVKEYRRRRIRGERVPFAFRAPRWLYPLAPLIAPRLGGDHPTTIGILAPLLRSYMRFHIRKSIQMLTGIYLVELAATNTLSSKGQGIETKLSAALKHSQTLLKIVPALRQHATPLGRILEFLGVSGAWLAPFGVVFGIGSYLWNAFRDSPWLPLLLITLGFILIYCLFLYLPFAARAFQAKRAFLQGGLPSMHKGSRAKELPRSVYQLEKKLFGALHTEVPKEVRLDRLFARLTNVALILVGVFILGGTIWAAVS